GLLAMSGAQAADLPVKAKAVEYVRICSLYGAGFFYIPGTDTCIKLGGYLRADTTFNGSIHGQPAWSGDLGQGNRYRDYFASRSRMALTVDTRTATEYGVVRTFGQADFQFSTQGNNTDTGVNNIQYTAQFGNGVSASIGLDDPVVWNRTSVYNLGPSGLGVGGVGALGTSANVYAGVHAPDVVGNIRVDQAWGLFQI